MSWKQWSLVGIVIGLGILWQIPEQHARPAAESRESAHAHESTSAIPAAEGSYRNVDLEITGMT